MFLPNNNTLIAEDPMAKARDVRFKGSAVFVLPKNKVSSFERAMTDGTARISVSVDLSSVGYTFGFCRTDERVRSGTIAIEKQTARKFAFGINLDVVVSVDDLRPKDWKEVDAGKFTCVFADVGAQNDWYLDAEFQTGVELEFLPV